MAKAARTGAIAVTDAVRYVAIIGLGLAGLAFFLLAILDAFRPTTIREYWLAAFLIDVMSGLIERLSEALQANWMLSFRRLSAFLIAVVLWTSAFLMNLILRTIRDWMMPDADAEENEEAKEKKEGSESSEDLRLF